MYKFKGWDTKRSKMFSPKEMGQDELTLNPDGRGFVNVNGTSIRLSQYCPHIIPLQFIWWTDINNKEIYVGDICRCNDMFIDFVEIGNGGFIFNGNCPETQATRPYNWNKIEVIGNIYENSELIKKGDKK